MLGNTANSHREYYACQWPVHGFTTKGSGDGNIPIPIPNRCITAETMEVNKKANNIPDRAKPLLVLVLLDIAEIMIVSE